MIKTRKKSFRRWERIGIKIPCLSSLRPPRHLLSQPSLIKDLGVSSPPAQWVFKSFFLSTVFFFLARWLLYCFCLVVVGVWSHNHFSQFNATCLGVLKMISTFFFVLGLENLPIVKTLEAVCNCGTPAAATKYCGHDQEKAAFFSFLGTLLSCQRPGFAHAYFPFQIFSNIATTKAELFFIFSKHPFSDTPTSLDFASIISKTSILLYDPPCEKVKLYTIDNSYLYITYKWVHFWQLSLSKKSIRI